MRGEVLVTSQDKPVADADLLVFAVDDAVLTLGDWKLPNIGARFYPRNVFSVRTYEALHGYIENLAKLSLTQKDSSSAMAERKRSRTSKMFAKNFALSRFGRAV